MILERKREEKRDGRIAETAPMAYLYKIIIIS